MPNPSARRPISLAILVVAISTLTPSFSYADEEELPVLATAQAKEDSFADSYVEVNEAKRADDSNYVTITWTLRNRGGDTISYADFQNDLYEYRDRSVSAVTALDEKEKIRYHPLQDENGFCICAGQFAPGDFMNEIKDKKSSPYWTSYIIPENISEISIEVPGFEKTPSFPVK